MLIDDVTFILTLLARKIVAFVFLLDISPPLSLPFLLATTALEGCTVAAAWPAGYSITATRTTWISTAAALGNLIKLSYLNGLPDTFKINAYDASLETGYTIAGTWYSIL